MRRKELATALGISVVLTLSGCGKDTATQIQDNEVKAETEAAEPTAIPTEAPAKVQAQTPTKAPTAEPTPTPAEAQEEEIEFIIEPIEPEQVMYATQNCNVRSGPSTEYEIVSALITNQEVTVNGKVTADNGKIWYVIKTEDNSIQMVSGSLLSATKVTAQSKQSDNSGNSGSTNNGSTGGGTATITSDCAVSDCSVSDCEGDCSVNFDNMDGFTFYSDCSSPECPDAGGIVAY